MSCGLTAITSVLASFAASSAVSTGTPYASRSSSRPLGPAHHDGHVRRGAPGAQQAGQQRLAHLPRAKYRDHDTDHSERRKNARFAGRSASRRTR